MVVDPGFSPGEAPPPKTYYFPNYLLKTAWKYMSLLNCKSREGGQGRGNQLRFINALVDLRGDARDALGIKFFRFHADFGKFGKIVYWHPPGGSWCPSGNIGSSIVMFLCSYNISSGNQNDLFPPLGLNIAFGFFPIFFRNFCMNCMICLLPPAYASR